LQVLKLLLPLQVSNLQLERSQLGTTYVRQTLSHFFQMRLLMLQLHLLK